MVLKREDAFEIAEEPPPTVFSDLGSGPYIRQTTYFQDFIRELFGTFVYQPGVYVEDRRDEPTVSLGAGDILPVQTVEGNELSDLVIAESPTGTSSVLDAAAVMTEAESLIWALNQPGVTFEEITLIRNRLAELGVTGGLAPTLMERAEDILLTPVQDVEVEEVAGFFDDLGDVFVTAAGTYLGGLADPSPQYFGPGSAPIGSTLPVPQSQGGMAPPPPPGVSCRTECGPYPVWKRVCGVYQWVYPKRRRRRQLLTESDYNGLLRIESLKVNKNMTVAIAKALTR